MATKPAEPAARRDESLAEVMKIWQRRAAGPRYASEAAAVLGSIGAISRQDFLEKFLDMEEKFPGRGWKQAMHELNKFYFERGLPLKGKPPRELGVEK